MRRVVLLGGCSALFSSSSATPPSTPSSITSGPIVNSNAQASPEEKALIGRGDIAVMWLVRHGDRWDYNLGRAHAVQIMESVGADSRDPSLSALGHEQARAVGIYISSQLKVDEPLRILSSPYLRVLQTAAPLARQRNSTIVIEQGLAEAKHNPSRVSKGAHQRFREGFVEVDLDGSSLYSFPESAFEMDESWPVGYLDRVTDFAAQLDATIGSGQCVACFSHAASVGLVAALTQSTLQSTLKLAPAGCYTLVRRGPTGTPWEVVRSGETNEPYILLNGKTPPWGFRGELLDAYVKERKQLPFAEAEACRTRQ